MNELVDDRIEEVRRYDIRTTCDRCGKPAACSRNNARYEIDEVTIQCESGQAYPEGSFTQFEGVDCCEECWDLVRAALVDLGFKVRAWDCDRKTVADYIDVG